MKLLKFLAGIIFILGCSRAQAATCTTLSSGATRAQIVSALNACGSGNTVVFNAGTYGPITSTVTIPCGVSMVGPTVNYSQSPNQTATINGSSSFIGWGFQTTSGCSASQTIEYVQWNGEHSNTKTNGGGFLLVNGGTTNLTVTNNYLHGADTVGADYGSVTGASSQIYFTGSGTTSNINITWNQLGGTSFGDCSGAFADSGGSEESGGSICHGVGINSNINNVNITNNNLTYLEEPMKVYSSGATSCTNVNINYNHFNQDWRIDLETQCYTGNSVSMNVQYNDTIAKYSTTNIQNDNWSIANGCTNSISSSCITHNDYNVILETSSCCDTGNEIWGGSASNPATNYATSTTTNYNLYQGYLYNAITWSAAGNLILNYNTFNIVNNGTDQNCLDHKGGFWNWNLYGNPPVPPTYTPTCVGNTFSNNITGTIASATPTISPASGSFTTSQTVTFTNTGTNRDTNTGIWYTTDGSTPVPGSGTAQYIASGGTIAVSVTTTVKAVGMWGAQNQPTSYPSGYGYVPSAVVSATYTAGAPPTLNSVTLSAAGGVTSIATGASVQMSAACHYNNGTTTSCNTPDSYGNSVSSWNTSASSIATINGSGLATGVAVGSTNLTAVAAGVTSSPFTLSVTAPTVTLTSVTLAGTGGVSSIVAGTTLQLIATCHYSDGSTTTCTTADAHGNSPSSWASTAPSIATVSSGGLVSAVAAGSTNITAVVAGLTSSPAMTLTVTAAPPRLLGGYLGTPGSANTMVVGGTLQFSAYCQYNTSPITTTNCTVADIYGNAVTNWTSSNTASVTIGAVGSANPGLATAVAAGSPYIHAMVGSVNLNQWDLTITNPAVSLTGVSLATAGGVTGLFIGHTNQLTATCLYSDGSSTNCTTTDSHGNVASNYTSSNSTHAAVGSTTGLVTGVAAGTTNLTAQAGSFTSPAVPLTVLAMPSGVYVITISGPVAFAGTVRF